MIKSWNKVKLNIIKNWVKLSKYYIIIGRVYKKSEII